tara:strand:- start:564 stop:1100 length:537 start_codon:yes stop_codon:yes gene_type:complete
MTYALVVATAIGFSLQRGRELAENNEPCKESCDAGHDSHCDQQDSSGKYTLSCDMHPTTSCDADCHYPPPPPLIPWVGVEGTFPSPPPPPPPPDEEVLIIAWLYFGVALVIFAVVCLCTVYGSRDREERFAVAYWCCCLLPVFRWHRGDDADDDDDRGPKQETGQYGTELPPVLLSDR